MFFFMFEWVLLWYKLILISNLSIGYDLSEVKYYLLIIIFFGILFLMSNYEYL